MIEALSKTEDDCQYKKKYEDLLREYQEFAYVVSHDLQSPVRQVNGFTEILLKELDAEITDHLKCYSDMIKHACGEASDSLDALLEFSRLNTEEKQFKTLDMNKLLQIVLRPFESSILKAGATIEVADLPEITGDQVLIGKLFAYLISNGLKFCEAGTSPEIEIGAMEEEGRTVFFVKDNGIGMKPDKIDESFIMFRRMNAADAFPGRGVGLTFAKKIVEIHNGEIWMATSPDKGTSVFFTLNL